MRKFLGCAVPPKHLGTAFIERALPREPWHSVITWYWAGSDDKDPKPPDLPLPRDGRWYNAASILALPKGRIHLGFELQAKEGAMKPVPWEHGQRSGWEEEQQTRFTSRNLFCENNRGCPP